MAACVQYPGVKFQRAPLIQGVEGNGKSFLFRAIARAVGERYSHFPNTSDLGGNGLKFNAWLTGKLFIGLEEIYTPGKRDVVEALKPLITSSKVEIQAKGADQYTGDNRANFMFCSNHKDAIQKTLGDRRYCIFYTAQQALADIYASGMGGDYFPNLYKWANAGGYAIITDYLTEYSIPRELNPAKDCHRAPQTTSTAEALKIGLEPVQQDILEACSQGRLGFCGGWISSVHLESLLEEKRHRIHINKRRHMLEGIGYVPVGRAGSPVGMDYNKKPVLYAKKGHSAINLGTLKDKVSAYIKEQKLDEVNREAV